MAKKRRRRRRRDDEKVLSPSAKETADKEDPTVAPPDQVLNAEGKTAESLQRVAILQMQQEYGNAHVQRYLDEQQEVQRQAESVEAEKEEEAEAEAAALAEREPIEFDLEMQLRGGGNMELRLQPALDLNAYAAEEDRPMLETIKEWRGIGGLTLDEEMFNVPETRMATDGRLTFPATDAFVARLAEMASEEAEAADLEGMEKEMVMERIFGRNRVKANATLHFNVAEPDIADLDLDKKDQFLGSDKTRSGVFLLISFEATGTNQKAAPLQAYVDGLFLFEGNF